MSYFFRKDSDRESCMEAIEERRREKIYPHLTCEEECKKARLASNMTIAIIMQVVDICG